ncbi:MAG: cache domain-containing protein, partial [bacterium]
MLNIKKIKFKILIPVMIIIFLMAFILTYVSINQSGKNIRKETRGKLEHMSTANANNFNTSLESIESKANSIHSLVQSTLDIEDLKNDENYMKNYKQQISPVIKEISETTDGILGAYVFFNPEVVNEAHDIYFVDEENTGNFTKQEELDEEDYNRESEDMSWFYKPYEEGQTVWSDPFYWESLDLDMFSFTRSIEIDGEHIGTVGIDIQFNDIKSRIEEINPYESGYAFLINEENNFIVHPDYNSSDSLSAMGIDNKRETIEDNESGVLKYTGDNNESSYLGYKKLTNGWTLGITVPEEEVMAGVKQSRNYLIFISIIIVLIATVIMLYTGNIIAKPITILS